MASQLTEAAEIRKLRKKLRQIENLERLTRPLNEQELIKVERKYSIREQLHVLLDRVKCSEAVTKKTSVSSAPESSQGHTEGVGEGDASQRRKNKGRGREARTNVVAMVPSSGGYEMNEKGDLKRGEPAAGGDASSQVLSAGDRAAEQTTKKERKAKRSKASLWVNVYVVVSELEGHNDLITSIAVLGSTLVSASRDTMVKVWDLEKGEETCSLGAHTEMVTSVLILSPEETALLNESQGEDSYIVSGSTDCTFKVWSLISGKLITSVYTFNPVTCLHYSYSAHLLVTASDGGKLELWDVKTAKNICSVRTHESGVTGVEALNNMVISSDAEGLVMVHEIRDGSLVRVFVSEDTKYAGSTRQVHRRCIRSLTATDTLVVFGDDTANLKLLDWKKGVLRKVVNHVSPFSSTDAVCVWEDVLLSSSYNLDKGHGYINVRSRSTGEYIASVDDEEEEGTERIVCLAATRDRSGRCILLSGGEQLKIWRLLPLGHSVPQSDHYKWVTVTHFLPALAEAACDSEPESELEGEEDKDDADAYCGSSLGRRRMRRKSSSSDDNDDAVRASWMSWCSVL